MRTILLTLIAAACFIPEGIQRPGILPLCLTGAILVCCAGLALTLRILRPAIGVTADHVIVRDWRRSQLIPWPSVTGFHLDRPSHWHGDVLALYVVCDDGRRLYTGGCSFSAPTYRQMLASACQTLRALEHERQSRGGAGAAPVAR